MNEPFTAITDLFASRGTSWGEITAWYLVHGVVQSNARWFVMARPCNSESPLDYCEAKDADSWWIHAFAGDMAACLAANRGTFTQITFNRVFKDSPWPRTYPYEQIERIAHGISRSTTTAATDQPRTRPDQLRQRDGASHPAAVGD